MIYISIIQACIVFQFFLVIFCDLTRVFANTLKSMLLRWVLAVSLALLGYYVQYLEYVHNDVVFVCFAVVLIVTFLTVHFIGKEYLSRLRKMEKLERKRLMRKRND